MASIQRFDVRTALWLATIGAVAVGIVNLIHLYSAPTLDLAYDPDSNLRMQQVRDWMAGQSWFDVRLARYGLEGFTPMHWTRLADLLPAALIAALKPFVGPAQAETIAVIAAPMVLRIPLFIACIWAVRRLVPEISTKVVGLSVLIIGLHLSLLNSNFMPGRIDHHNLQLVAFAIFIGGFLGERTFRSGLISSAGLIAGLVVGLDALPHVAAAILGVGILWLLEPQRERAFLQGIGIGTLALTIVCGPIFIPQPWTTTWCDSWTVPLAAIMLGFGAVVLLIAGPLGQLDQIWKRFAAAGIFGSGVLATMFWAFPSCRNPLPLQDPLITKYWMGSIGENANAFQLMAEFPNAIFEWLLPAVAAGYFLYSIRLNRFQIRPCAPLLITLAVGFLFGALYYRGLPILNLLTLLTLTPLLIQIFVSIKASDKRVTLYACVSIFILIGSSVLGILRDDSKSANKPATNSTSNKTVAEGHCLDGKALSRVQALPPGLMIAAFGPSEYLLRTSHHTTSFAGYHRAKEGNLWTIRWLIATPDAAKAMLKEHRPRYLNICPLAQQLQMMATGEPKSLIAQLMKGNAPDWLKPVATLSGGGKVYEIQP